MTVRKLKKSKVSICVFAKEKYELQRRAAVRGNKF